MATTSFQTKFLIGAKYTGASEVAKANRGIDSVERNLKGLGRGLAGAHKSMIGLGTAVKGAAAAFAGLYVIQKTSQLLHSSIDAAFGVAKAHDQLGAALERNKGRLKSTGISVAEQKKRFIELAEAQEKLGGFDAEMMERGYAKLLDTMSPGQIERFSKSYSDMIAKMTDGQPTEESVLAITKAYNLAIAQKSPRILRALNASKKELETFKNLNSQEERRLFLEKFMLKFQRETARQSETTSGKIRQMHDATGNLLETIGKPFADRAKQFAESIRGIAIAAGPLAEQLAGQLAVAFEKFAKWLINNKDEIVKWGQTIIDWTKWAWESFWWLSQKSEEVLKPIWDNTFKEWNYVWPKLQAFFTDLWANTQKEFEALWPIISKFGTDLWANTLKEWEQLKKIVEWIDTNIIKPISALFDWLVKKISDAWALIEPIWTKMNAPVVPPGTQVTPTIKPGMDWRYPSEGGAGGTTPPAAATTPAAAAPTTMSAAAAGSTAAALDAKLGGRLKGQGATIVAAANRHHVDPYLLASIAQVESAKGTSYSIRTRNAPVGMMDPRNPSRHQSFASLEAGIEAGAALLERGYISQGRTTPASIGAKWAPPGASNDPNRTNASWPGQVAKERARLLEGAKPTASLDTTTRSLNKRGSGRDNFSPISLTLSPQTTINGASAGQEQALLRQHERILQNTNREFLAKLQEVKNEQERKQYV